VCLVRKAFNHVGPGRVEEGHSREVDDQRFVFVLDPVEAVAPKKSAPVMR
jgi:hypothetical protein